MVSGLWQSLVGELRNGTLGPRQARAGERCLSALAEKFARCLPAQFLSLINTVPLSLWHWC